LAEFSPIYWANFLFGQFFEDYKISPIYWATFFNGKSYAYNLTKNGLGYILGDFFTSSSGHPDRCSNFGKTSQMREALLLF
jgi:hypothetical protein